MLRSPRTICRRRCSGAAPSVSSFLSSSSRTFNWISIDPAERQYSWRVGWGLSSGPRLAVCSLQFGDIKFLHS